MFAGTCELQGMNYDSGVREQFLNLWVPAKLGLQGG